MVVSVWWRDYVNFHVIWGAITVSVHESGPLIAQAKPYLIWIIVVPVVNVAAYIWDSIFLGATASKALRNSVMLSTLLFLGAIYLLTPFGNHGLWGALTLLLVARGVSLTVLAPKYLFWQDESGY